MAFDLEPSSKSTKWWYNATLGVSRMVPINHSGDLSHLDSLADKTKLLRDWGYGPKVRMAADIYFTDYYNGHLAQKSMKLCRTPCIYVSRLFPTPPTNQTSTQFAPYDLIMLATCDYDNSHLCWFAILLSKISNLYHKFSFFSCCQITLFWCSSVVWCY